MEIILASQRNQNLENNSQQTYTVIKVEGIQVRAKMKQYEEKQAIVLFIWGFSFILGVTIPLALVQINLDLGLFPFFIGTGVGFIPLNVLVICYRDYYSNLFIFWSISTNITLLTLGILFACELPFCGITLASYCTIELIATLFLTRNKTIPIIKLLLFFQLVVLGYKLDGIVGIDWRQVLTGLAILFVFIACLGLLLIIYSLFGGLYCLNLSVFAIRKKGAIFSLLSLLCLCCLIGSILQNSYFDVNQRYLLKGAAFFSWSTTIFTFPNITAITLCFCKFQLLKQKQIAKLQKMQQNQVQHLFKASSNWLNHSQKIQLTNQNRQCEQCVGCMSKKANATWMPCGHCIFCFECAESLIKVNVRCGLCKQWPTHILKIDQITRYYSGKILSKNQVSVVQSFQIR